MLEPAANKPKATPVFSTCTRSMKPGITVSGGLPASDPSARCLVHWSTTSTASETIPSLALNWEGVLIGCMIALSSSFQDGNCGGVPALVCDRDVDAGDPEVARATQRAVVKPDGWALARLPHHLYVAEPGAGSPAGAERFEHRLLGREQPTHV